MSDSGRPGFLSRWSQRKILARENRLVGEDDPAPGLTVEPQAGQQGSQPRPGIDGAGRDMSGAALSAEDGTSATSAASLPDAAVPQAGQTRETSLPSLEDVKLLTPESDFSPFVARGVAPAVKNAAMKKLFADPHFNVMDGLDIYIDDYTQREILPESMMRKMASSKFLRMFSDEDDAKMAAAAEPVAGVGQEAGELAAAPSQPYPQDEHENSAPVLTDMVSSLEEARKEIPEAASSRTEASETRTPDTGTPPKAMLRKEVPEFSGVMVTEPVPVPETGTQAVTALGVYPGLPTAIRQVQNRPEASRTSITKSEQQPGNAPSDAEPYERSN